MLGGRARRGSAAGGPLPRPWRTRVLLVGTSRFADSGQRAPRQVPADLRAMRAVLTDPELGVAARLRCSTLLDGTAADVLAAVRQRRWRPTDDLLIVYYSGHGFLHPRTHTLWLSTYDSDVRSADGRLGLEYRRLAETLRGRANARQVLVVLDCCYSGNALADVPDTPGYYVLASVQKNRRTPQPPDGELSPYTEVLVDVLRHGDPGTDTSEGLTVGHLADVLSERFGRRFIDAGTVREVAAETLTEQQQDAKRWKPRHSVTDGSMVVSRPEGRPEPPSPGPAVRLAEGVAFVLQRAAHLAGRGLRRPAEWAGRVPQRVRVPLVVVLATALAAGGTAVAVRAASGTAHCAPPLELRVLTGTGDETAVAKAADAFETSRDNHRSLGPGDHDPGGCRRINVAVTGAATNAVVSAFRAAAAWSGGVAAPDAPACAVSSPAAGSLVSSCPAPLRDVGPQPDVWIPDSSAELALAQQAAGQGRSGVRLSDEGSVATSPLVVAVSPATARRLAAAGVPATASWQRLVPALRVPLLRPSPITSGTGLLQTAGLYLDWTGVPGGERITEQQATDLEHTAAAYGESAPDGESLLCGLEQQAGAGTSGGGVFDQVAAAVSEKAVHDLAQGGLSGAGCGLETKGGQALVELRPAGIPALDLPFTAVRWPGTGDEALRGAAAERFRGFLLGPAGQAVLRMHGYRAPQAGAGQAALLTAARLATVLTEYRSARQPAQVLFLVDVSGSMARDGRLAAAVDAVRQGLGGLGPQDSWGIWTMPGGTAGKGPAEGRLRLDTHPHSAARPVLASLQPLPLGAALYSSIAAAGRALEKRDGPRLLVVLTDGDDTKSGEPLTAYTDALGTLTGGGRDIQLDAIAMEPGVCGEGDLTVLAHASGGQCLPASAQLGQVVAGLVATAGEGRGGAG